MFYLWLGIVLLLGVVEAMTANLVCIWFILSGLVSLVLSFYVDNFIIELLVFILLGIILLVLTKKKLEEKLVRKEKTNFDRIIGMKGIVTEEIDELVVGEVKVDGKKWSAISDDKIEVGERVRILKIKGVKLEVERVKE